MIRLVSKRSTQVSVEVSVEVFVDVLGELSLRILALSRIPVDPRSACQNAPVRSCKQRDNGASA
jgi:hypothetical protein